MKNKVLLSIVSCSIMLVFTACTQIAYKEVYIPVKCEIPERIKPKKEDYVDYTQFQAHLRSYYKGIERDLAFCRNGEKKE